MTTALEKQIARQAALVGKLGRHLHFELLVLRRLRDRQGSGELDPTGSEAAMRKPRTVSDVLAAAQDRRIRDLLTAAVRCSDDDPQAVGE